MSFLSIFSRVANDLAATRQRRRDMQALSDLNAHMLKDIGLRWEAEALVPLYPAALEDAKAERSTHDVDRDTSADGNHVKGVTDIANGALHSKRTVASNAKVGVCRHCGERLA